MPWGILGVFYFFSVFYGLTLLEPSFVFSSMITWVIFSAPHRCRWNVEKPLGAFTSNFPGVTVNTALRCFGVPTWCAIGRHLAGASNSCSCSCVCRTAPISGSVRQLVLSQPKLNMYTVNPGGKLLCSQYLLLQVPLVDGRKRDLKPRSLT